MNAMERFARLKSNIVLLWDQAGNKKEVNALEDHIRLLSGVMAPLSETAENVTFLREHGISVDLPDASIQFARVNLQKLATSFSKKPNAQTLRKSDFWVNVRDTLVSLDKNVPTITKAAWERWVLDRAASEPPAELWQRIARTPDNQAAMSEYERTYNLLLAITRTLPDDEAVFAQIDEHIAGLKAARTKIKFDVPEAVKRFFDEMASGAVSMTLVTPEVYEWLRQNNELGRYRVNRSLW